jgi:predicted RNase H-like HicB family nuclease
MSHGTRRYNGIMEAKRFIYYQEDGFFVGWLEEYPDYRTQGETMDELRENLRDVYKDVTSGEIPCIRKVGELSIA